LFEDLVVRWEHSGPAADFISDEPQVWWVFVYVADLAGVGAITLGEDAFRLQRGGKCEAEFSPSSSSE
jgi:hypothetical protein